MRILAPYLALYKRHKWLLLLGIVLAIITLLASIGLLTLSGWFLSASAVVGASGLYSFNYMLPAAGVRGAAIIRTAGRYFERLVSHDATFRVLEHLRVFTFSRLLPLSPAGLARFRQGDLLNRVVADVDTLDHLYLRVISPLVGALVVIVVVTFRPQLSRRWPGADPRRHYAADIATAAAAVLSRRQARRREPDPASRSVSPAAHRLAAGAGGAEHIWRQRTLPRRADRHRTGLARCPAPPGRADPRYRRWRCC
ncbi:Probable ABC transporter ATP-binding protein HI_0664 [Pluralibacter gergoviae]|nr:Probable ABC transporter ATP-binding protein HI_0664 [Pluralibacter gergoviae]